MHYLFSYPILPDSLQTIDTFHLVGCLESTSLVSLICLPLNYFREKKKILKNTGYYLRA